MFAAGPGLSASASTSVPVPRLSAAIPGLSVAVPGLSAPASASVPVPRLSAAVPGSSAFAFASVLLPQLSTAMPGSSVSMSASVYVPGLSAAIPGLSLLNIPTPNLAVKRRKLDDIISGWSGRSKRASSKELCSGRIKKTALEEPFLPRTTLFPLLFPSSGIGKRKFDKIFINTRPLANNHAKKEVDLCFTMCGCPPAIRLNKPWQIEILEQRPACIVKMIPLAAAIFWDPNFVLYPCHTLKLATKLGLKTRNLPSALVKKCI